MTAFINQKVGMRYSFIVRNHEWMFTRINSSNLVVAIDDSGTYDSDVKIYAKQKINPDNHMNWEQETIQEMLEDKLNKQQLSNIDLERIMFQIM
jgi:hypothetical protein